MEHDGKCCRNQPLPQLHKIYTCTKTNCCIWYPSSSNPNNGRCEWLHCLYHHPWLALQWWKKEDDTTGSEGGAAAVVLEMLVNSTSCSIAENQESIVKNSFLCAPHRIRFMKCLSSLVDMINAIWYYISNFKQEWRIMFMLCCGIYNKVQSSTVRSCAVRLNLTPLTWFIQVRFDVAFGITSVLGLASLVGQQY